ncbi:MAG: hypothetical protein PUJ62_13620, partial [Lachnospiraceae bacterium]|nr:hypothetical protein [Lachnospiraceae bacterium]
VSLVVIGILIGKNYFGNSSFGNTSEVMLSEDIEVSNVYFDCNRKNILCSFVPSIGNDEITYSVTLSSYDNSFPSATVVSEYENGICVAAFDVSKLSEYARYSVVLSIEYQGEVRNLMLADGFTFTENSCSWEN